MPPLWRVLLGACSIHGDVELAEEVKLRLSELEPSDSGDHILLSNLCRYREVEGLCSCEKNEITKQAYEKLREIMLRIRIESGYIAETNTVLYDVEDEEKEDAVSRHSEKLAVAFGMIRLSKGSVTRILKNLRICGDCHTVMKLISKVYSLEIVARDRSRLRSFKDGSCTCRDYW